MEGNLGKARDQDSYGRNEYLDLNKSVGGSLSENVCWKCRHVLMALSMNEEWVEGVGVKTGGSQVGGPNLRVLA